MNDHEKLISENKLSDKVGRLPSSESFLTKLGIDPSALKSIKPHSKRRHYRAVVNWLTKEYKPQDNSNLEKVRHYLEAFNHLCEVEAWEKAKKILWIRFINDIPLHNQFSYWGYPRQQIDLLNRLVGKLNASCDVMCFNGIGNANHDISEYNEKHLKIAQEKHNPKWEADALSNIGNAYNFLEDYQQGKNYCQQALNMAREIGDYDNAIYFYKKSLIIIAKNSIDYDNELTALESLGNIYNVIKDYVNAKKYYQQYLELAKELDLLQEQSWGLNDIGNIFYNSREYVEALKYYQQSQLIYQKIKNFEFRLIVLKNIGNTYYAMADYSYALEYYQQSLALAQQLGNRSMEALVLGYLG